MTDINSEKFVEGLTVGAINEILIGQLSKLTKKDEKGKDVPLLSSEQMRWISAIVGGVVSEATGGNAGQGGSIADSATANNFLKHEGIYKNNLSEAEAYEKDLADCGTDEKCKERVRLEYKELSDANIANGAENDRSGNYIIYNELYNQETNVPSSQFGSGKATNGNDFISKIAVENKIIENLSNLSTSEKNAYINAISKIQEECSEKEVRELLFKTNANNIIQAYEDYNKASEGIISGTILNEQQKIQIIKGALENGLNGAIEQYEKIAQDKVNSLYNSDTDIQQVIDLMKADGYSNKDIAAMIESSGKSIEEIATIKTTALATTATTIVVAAMLRSTILTNEQARANLEELARQDILSKGVKRVETSNEIVIGRSIYNSDKSYEVIAKTRGSSYFNMPDAQWKELTQKYGKDVMEKANLEFIQKGIDENKTFILTSNPYKVPSDAMYAKELSLIKEAQYKIIEYGDNLWKAIPK